jgi:hypothetical protein
MMHIIVKESRILVAPKERDVKRAEFVDDQEIRPQQVSPGTASVVQTLKFHGIDNLAVLPGQASVGPSRSSGVLSRKCIIAPDDFVRELQGTTLAASCNGRLSCYYLSGGNESTYLAIPIGATHRIENPGRDALHIDRGF